jgi:hypothetical protein
LTLQDFQVPQRVPAVSQCQDDVADDLARIMVFPRPASTDRIRQGFGQPDPVRHPSQQSQACPAGHAAPVRAHLQRRAVINRRGPSASLHPQGEPSFWEPVLFTTRIIPAQEGSPVYFTRSQTNHTKHQG